MSNELILSEPANDQTQRIEIVHGAVHDLESFFWVLCWLVTFYDAPGMPKEELPKDLQNLFEVPAQGLDNSKMGFAKRDIINTKRCKYYLTDYISEYFEPLKDTIEDLANLFQEHYKTRVFTGMHEKFLKVLDDAENNCQVNKPKEYVITGINEKGQRQFMHPEDEVKKEMNCRKNDFILPSKRRHSSVAEG